MKFHATLSNWSMLPNDLIDAIGQCLLKDVANYIRCRAVCKAWREATLDPRKIEPAKLPPQLPWLMLSFDEDSEGRSFDLLSDKKVITLSLPETIGTRIVGSTQGWLVLVNFTHQIILYNPLTRAQKYVSSLYELPLMIQYFSNINNKPFECKKFPRDLVLKKLVICHPEEIVMSTDNVDHVAFRVPKLDRWLDSDIQLEFRDIVNYNGKIYAVHESLTMFMFEINPTCIDIKHVAEFRLQRLNLVESLGELLLVVGLQRSQRPDFQTYKFLVYKVKFHNDIKADYIPLTGIGDQALFIGPNQAMSFSAKEYKGKVEANCIYFTSVFIGGGDDDNYSGDDSGIFSFEDGTVKSLPYNHAPDKRSYVWPPPVWLQPNALG